MVRVPVSIRASRTKMTSWKQSVRSSRSNLPLSRWGNRGPREYSILRGPMLRGTSQSLDPCFPTPRSQGLLLQNNSSLKKKSTKTSWLYLGVEMWGGMRNKVCKRPLSHDKLLRRHKGNIETWQSIKENFNSQKTYFSILNLPINQRNAN